MAIAVRRLHSLGLLPEQLREDRLKDELGRPANGVLVRWFAEAARSRRRLVVFAQLFTPEGGPPFLHMNDARGAQYWVPLPAASTADAATVVEALVRLQQHIGKELT